MAPELDEPLQGFYTGFAEAEARHFEIYLDLAARAAADRDIDTRKRELAELEAQLIEAPDPQFRFHSGVPASSG